MTGRTAVWEFELADDAAFIATMPAKSRAAVSRIGARLVRGAVLGKAGSWVRLAWYGGAWHGGFYDGLTLYLIDPPEALAGALPRRPESAQSSLLYRFDNVIWPLFAADETLRPPDFGGRLTYPEFAGHLSRLAAGDLRQLPVTLVSDTEFSAIHGTNTAAVVAARVFFIDGIYSAQVGISIGMHHQEILAANGALTATDPNALINQFKQFMTSGAGASIPRFMNRANTHLFTGRDLDGGVIGIAFLGVLCNFNSGFGIDQNLNNATTASLVFAHELGHNFGAPHDGQDECAAETFQGIMNPSINGSQQFSNCSIEQMQDDIAAATCFAILPQAIFSDSFENG